MRDSTVQAGSAPVNPFPDPRLHRGRRFSLVALRVKSKTLMCNYKWPGNVRELENFIERAVILTNGSELQAPLTELRSNGSIPQAVPNALPIAAGDSKAASSHPMSLEDVERAHIEEILKQTRGVIGGKGGAAEILGLPISTLRNRMKKLGLK